MKPIYFIILIIITTYSCTKKSNNNTYTPTTVQPVDSDSIATELDTCYFDTLSASYDGASKIINDSMLIYEDGTDKLYITITKNASNKSYLLTAQCKRLNASFTLPDSLKTKANIELTQQQQGYTETIKLNFSNDQEPQIKISQNWPISQGSNYKSFYSFK